MSHPLKMQCPECRKIGEHPVYKTDPNFYYLPIFRTVIREDFLYRTRKKSCIYCGSLFDTVEISREDFDVIESKFKELEKEKNRADYFEFHYNRKIEQRDTLQQEVDSLKKIIRDLAVPIQQIEQVLAAASIAKVLAAAPIEHNSSPKKDETYVDNEEIDDDDDNN